MHEHQDKEKLAYNIKEVAKLTGLSVSYVSELVHSAIVEEIKNEFICR